MIKKQRTLYGLSKWKYLYQEVDRSTVFSLADLPSSFKVGKNSFKILASRDKLVKNSEVYIDIIDSNDQPIYIEISNLVNKDGTRNIVVYIYDETAAGDCRLQIAGTVIDQNTVSPNYLFQTKIKVEVDKTVDNDIIFKEFPIIKYSERLQPVQKKDGGSRLTILPNLTGSISIVSTTSPRQLAETALDVETNGIQTSINSISISNNQSVDSIQKVPEYLDYSVLASKNYTFVKEMQGGKIELNSIHLPYPPDVLNPVLFLSKSYVGSVISVKNSSSIEIYPPIKFDIEYIDRNGALKYFSTNKVFNHTNFTTSYYQYLDVTSSISTQSFVSFDIYNLEPEIGSVDSIQVSYKPINQLGDFKTLGIFKIGSLNLLTTTSSLEFNNELGIVEKSIGSFRNGMVDFNNYWVTRSYGTGSIVVDTQKIKVQEGIRVYQTSKRGISDRWSFQPISSFTNYAHENSSFQLKLKTYSEQDEVYKTKPQVDIYISGTANIEPYFLDNRRLDHAPIITSSFGTYIGSLTEYQGKTLEKSFDFKTVSSGSVLPIFVFRSGVWHISDVQINPQQSIGYSPNQFRFNIPIENIEKSTELLFKVEYLNSIGKTSNYNSTLKGVYFSGSSIPNDRIIQKVGSGQKITYLYTQTGFSASDLSSNNISIVFPIFQDENGRIYTGSRDTVGISYTVQATLLGRSGSSQNQNTYIWAGTVQGRGIISNVDNSGAPLMLTPIAFSGSTNFLLGTFGGNTTSKPNIDSWFRFTGTQVDAANGSVNFRYTLRTVTPEVWNIDLTATCDVLKYEISR